MQRSHAWPITASAKARSCSIRAIDFRHQQVSDPFIATWTRPYRYNQ